MSTGTIKSIQQSGTTWEVLAVTDAGQTCRVQTDGGLASLVSGLQTQTAQLAARQAKPELSVGQVVDFTPVVPVVVIPTQAEIDRATFYTQVGHELALARFASLSPDTQKLCSDPAWIDGMPR